ncbi:MAG TPA: hypothetical protein V6C85_39075 [Allocoleopsis sp.]
MKNTAIIIAQSRELAQSNARKPTNQKSPWEARSPSIEIASISLEEQIDPSEPRYCLIIQPQGLRACGGQFTAKEVGEIEKAGIKSWDWSLSPAGRPNCLPKLEALLERICDRSEEGGEST